MFDRFRRPPGSGADVAEKLRNVRDTGSLKSRATWRAMLT
jgi:hypothetical protein